MTAPLLYETLHGHTIYSDGLLTHAEVLDLCQKNAIGIVAFTDHEALLDSNKFNELKKLNHDVHFISGIELTFNSIDGVRIPHTESGHIIGLFVDPTNSALAAYCERAQHKRIEKIEHNIKELVALGFSITFNDVAQEVRGHSYAKPHLVTALIKKSKNITLLDSILKKMQVESTQNETLKMRYERILTHDTTRRVYDLLLGSHPYIKISNAEIDAVVDFDRVVSMIRDAGGVASIAHWFTIDGAIDTQLLTELIQSKKLDGIETRYGFYDPPEMQKGLAEQMDHLSSLAQKLNCITTGGVDLHKPADLENINTPQFIQRTQSTIGMTKALLQKCPTISKTWSTL